MQLYKSAAFFFLVATAAAGPLPQDPLSSHIITRDTAISQEIYDIKRDDIVSFDLEDRSELSTRQAPSVRDVTCPDNKKTYTAEAIKTAMSSENAKASPGEYKNKEGGKQLFAVPTSTQLYKASLDNVARAVFSRNANNGYVYRGVIEHDKGTGNGFHKC